MTKPKTPKIEESLSRRERERIQHRRQILQAAGELLAEKRGFYNVSMQEIADRSEFAIGTLYNFFKNKEDLYRSLVLDMAHSFIDEIMIAFEDDSDVLETLKRYIRLKAEILSRQADLIRIHFAESQTTGFSLAAGIDKELRDLKSLPHTKIVALFERGIKENLFRENDPALMVTAFEGALDTFIFDWIENSGGRSYEKGIKTISEIFFRGVLVS